MFLSLDIMILKNFNSVQTLQTRGILQGQVDSQGALVKSVILFNLWAPVLES